MTQLENELLDIRFRPADNSIMAQSVEQVVRDQMRSFAAVRRKFNTPAKARAFLVTAGILEKHRSSPKGVRLAKPYRD